MRKRSGWRDAGAVWTVLALVIAMFAVIAPPAVAQEDPYLEVALDEGVVRGYGFVPGETATVFVYDEPGGALVYRATKDIDENGYWGKLTEPLSAGMYVRVETSGGGGYDYTIENLSIEEIDFESSVARGFGQPETAVTLSVRAHDDVDEEEATEIVANVDANGAWLADLSVFDGLTPLVEVDVRSQVSNGGSELRWWAPSALHLRRSIVEEPHLTLVNFPGRTELDLTIARNGAVDSTTFTTFRAGHQGFHSSLLLPGAQVTVAETAGTGIETFVVPELSITSFDAVAHIVTGTAAPLAAVLVTAATSETVIVEADAAGFWQAEFSSGSFYPQGIEAEVRDARGNRHRVEFGLDPSLHYDETAGTIAFGNTYGNEAGGSLRVYDPEGDIVYELLGGTFIEHHEGLVSLDVVPRPGSTIEVEYNIGLIVSHVVADLDVTIDSELGVVTGSGPPGAELRVSRLSVTSCCPGVRIVVANDGTWEADFAERDIDLGVGFGIEVVLTDPVTGTTRTTRLPERPRLNIDLRHGTVRAMAWTAAAVTVEVFDGDNQVFGPNTTDPGQHALFVPPAALSPGNVVRVTDSVTGHQASATIEDVVVEQIGANTFRVDAPAGWHARAGGFAGFVPESGSFETDNEPNSPLRVHVTSPVGDEFVTWDSSATSFGFVGIPGEDVGELQDAGAALIVGLDAVAQVSPGAFRGVPFDDAMESPRRAGDRAGASSVRADLNHDGYPDLAFGVPGRAVDGNSGAGAVVIFFGDATGSLGSGSTAVLTQSTPGVAGVAESGDEFGAALAMTRIGDYVSLVVGAPGESIAGVLEAGMVHRITLGTDHAVMSDDRLYFGQGLPGEPEAGDRLGEVLSGGYGDLAIGVPNKDLGAFEDAGIVLLHDGDSVRHLDQNSNGIAGKPETGDRFGASVASGWWGLAIGVPGEDLGGITDAGMVQLFEGWRGNCSFTQSTPGIPGTPEPGDRFGAALGAVQGDLYVGVPGESLGPSDGAGLVHRLTFLSDNPSDTGCVRSVEVLRQGAGRVAGRAESGDAFGSTISGGYRYNWEVGGVIVFIGSPGEDLGSVTDAGMVTLVSNQSATNIHQGTPAVPGAVEAGDTFGAAVLSVGEN